jgi:hypothetical protein
MAADVSPVRGWDAGSGGLRLCAAPTVSRGARSIRSWTFALFQRRFRKARDASILGLVWQTIWFGALGPQELDHDVSGTVWQILAGAMLLITTIMPVRQCGHSLRDRPLSALKRSR